VNLTILVTPDGGLVSPDAPDFLAAVAPAHPDGDPVAYAIKQLGFIRFQTIEQTVVEIELHPRKVKLQALLAVQQQSQAADHRLFRIKYLDAQWRSEICSSVEHAIERLSELCAPVFMPATSDMFIVEPRDLSAVFDDREHRFRPLAQKWRVSFGHFDPTVIAMAVQHDLLPYLVVVGVKPIERDPVFRFIGQGHKWVGNDTARVGDRVAEQPDKPYGRWVSEFYIFVASSRQPRYDIVTAELRDAGDGARRTVCYERLLLPWKTQSNEVFVTSCSAIIETPSAAPGTASPGENAAVKKAANSP
jgi:hypothetical protein